MLNISAEDRKFITDNITNANEILQSDNVNDILDPLYDWIDENGFSEESSFHDYNDAGREAQKVYDRLYYNN